MGRINSKTKGSKNERALAKAFKDWTGYEFTRVPSSGGLRWKRTLDTTGDIMVAEQEHIFEFPFSVETKFHNEIDPWKILLGYNSKLDEFIHQARQDAKRSNKIPIVFFRFNGMTKDTWFVIVEKNTFDTLNKVIFCENGFMNFNDEFVIFTSEALFLSDYKQVLNYLRNGSLRNNTTKINS